MNFIVVSSYPSESGTSVVMCDSYKSFIAAIAEAKECLKDVVAIDHGEVIYKDSGIEVMEDKNEQSDIS